MKFWSFLYLFVTDSSFRYWLKLTLGYAIISHEKNRGFGSSDVLLFQGRYQHKIFTDPTLKKFEYWESEYYTDKEESQA